MTATAMFNHGNLALPSWLDRWRRLVLVTPAVHRTHHLEIRAETDSVLGLCLPW